MTKRMKFKCTLKSDVIISQTSSTEGNQKTLDFIPGNKFLGIVAGSLYDRKELTNEQKLAIFHSGKVRFGDAHPSAEGFRGLKVPASMYYPKLGSASQECYIHHLTDHSNKDIKAKQLKQCREGFYIFKDQVGRRVQVQKNFAIKSAYDKETRRSKDGQMFGYESLTKDLVLYFEVESDLTDELNNLIEETLRKTKHIGHSRTAEYGVVEIENADYQEMESALSPAHSGYISVYADGRLIFLDENDEPTYQPDAKALGLEGGEIDWSKSQIRTFHYAPWNGKRHTYDTDRCGIEKGSVFVVKRNKATCPEKSQYVGYYQNEGFGKVIYNPAFLAEKTNGNGLALFTLGESQSTEPASLTIAKPDTPLIAFLTNKKETATSNRSVYQLVQEEIAVLSPLFQKGKFASQWGSIRSIAMITTEGHSLTTAVENFLNHGVAKDKWEERGRKEKLIRFMKAHETEDLQNIIINLASEMAKRCTNKEED